MGQSASGGGLLAQKVQEKLKGSVALLPDHHALASTYKCTKGELNPLARLRWRPVALLALRALLMVNSSENILTLHKTILWGKLPLQVCGCK